MSTSTAERLESVTGLLHSIAIRYANDRIDREELVQVGVAGVLSAIERFDPELSSFSNFAAITASGAMRHYLRDNAWSIRPPRRVQEATRSVRLVQDELEQALGRPPTNDELAEQLGCASALVAEARAATHSWSPQSIDALRLDGAPFDAGDFDPDFETVETLRSLSWGRLTPNERQAVWRSYLIGERQRDIAQDMGVTQMTVSRWIQRGLEKLRFGMAT